MWTAVTVVLLGAGLLVAVYLALRFRSKCKALRKRLVEIDAHLTHLWNIEALREDHCDLRKRELEELCRRCPFIKNPELTRFTPGRELRGAGRPGGWYTPPTLGEEELQHDEHDDTPGGGHETR